MRSVPATTTLAPSHRLPQRAPAARSATRAAIRHTTRAQHRAGSTGGGAAGREAGGTASRRRVLASLPPCACAVCAGSAAAQQQKERNEAMDKLFASAMATGMMEYEDSIAPMKRRLFSELLGGLASPAAQQDGGRRQPAQLLELGVGTGPNLRYYAEHYGLQPAAGAGSSGSSSGGGSGGSGGSAPGGLPPLHITGLDPNAFMRPYLEQNLAAAGWPQERFSWVQGSAEAMPLQDASFDAVVCTLVLCSVADVQPVLAEVARVLRPGGSLLCIEHTTAQFQARPLLWVGQRLLEPLQVALADNCHLTRDPLPAIQAHPAFSGEVQASRFSVDGVFLISPHVAGIARRQGEQQDAAEQAAAAAA